MQNSTEYLSSEGSIWGVAGIEMNERNRYQVRKPVNAMDIENGIERYKIVGQEIRGGMTTLVNMKK